MVGTLGRGRPSAASEPPPPFSLDSPSRSDVSSPVDSHTSEPGDNGRAPGEAASEHSATATRGTGAPPGASAPAPSEPAASPEPERLGRFSAVIAAYSSLARELDALEQALIPVRELLLRQARTVEQLERNLDDELEPVREYAAMVQANLDQLLARLDQEGSTASRALRMQFELERQRAEGVQATMEQVRAPLQAEFQRETAAIDALLSVFDSDVERLESTLVAGRRDALRLTTRLQSEGFEAALGFVRHRSMELGAMAAAGVSEPEEIQRTLRLSRERAQEEPLSSTDLKRVLDALDGQPSGGTLAESVQPHAFCEDCGLGHVS
jgi:hypothetical protein